MGIYKASFRKHRLEFKNAVRTSRNELKTHDVFYVRLQRLADNKITYGEAAPLKGLSIDDVPDLEQKIQEVCDAINEGMKLPDLELERYPSITFAFETAFLAMKYDEAFKLFDTPFYNDAQAIEINGLVWMNETETMLQEALDKAGKGFNTIKFKVGALDFDAECRMLESFRKRYDPFKITLRLDANGAFKNTDALEQLKEFSRFGIHSIEQPVKAGQPEIMQEVCAKSKIAVALDEELIGVDVLNNSARLLDYIKPAYIILKPTLLGGLQKSDLWIQAANKNNIGWWATSALESNIGLNAIAQWASTYNNQLPQGLGTGGLYVNNIESPLRVDSGKIYYSRQEWDMAMPDRLFE